MAKHLPDLEKTKVRFLVRVLCLRPIWIAALGCGPSSLRRVRFRYRQTPHLQSPRFGGGFRVDRPGHLCYDQYMDLIRRLATSQARGERQLSLVNELVSYKDTPIFPLVIPVYGGTTTHVYGRTHLPGSSWRNLRKRLVSVGFIFIVDRENMTVTMSFPEAE